MSQSRVKDDGENVDDEPLPFDDDVVDTQHALSQDMLMFHINILVKKKEEKKERKK